MTNTYIRDYTNTFIIHGHKYEVTAPAKFDSDTNELIDDMKLDDQAIEIANSMYRAEFNLVSPQDIKIYRSKIGLSQREFAKLLRWSPNTIALYETGAFPSESNNQILKTLMANDELLRDFIKQNNNLPNSILEKLNDYLNGGNSDLVASEVSAPEFTAVQLTNWYRVTNYFAAQKDENIEHLTQMKVVKLLYFAYGRYLARTQNKLFSSPIIAMPYGPVVEEVHQTFSGKKDLISGGIEDEAFEDFSDVQKNSDIVALLQEILDDYGDKTAYGLSKITHKPGSPWSLTGRGIIEPFLIAETFRRGVEE